MFAKVFGQIFDSSIAEDYNCRRMFMDLLVLADSDGAVDMTPEAISRRTNVPIEEVTRYLKDLCQPDSKSRSQLHEGKRLIPLDDKRDWGWLIVNYKHYREIRDEEARRAYFRDAMRKSRARKKKEMYLTDLTNVDELQPPASAYSSVLKEGVRGRFEEWMTFRKGLGKKPKNWTAMFDKQAQWLTQFPKQDQIAIIDQSIRNGWQGLFELRRNERNGSNGQRQMSAFEIEKRCAAISEEISNTFKRNGNKRVEGDGIDALKQRRDELKKQMVA